MNCGMLTLFIFKLNIFLLIIFNLPWILLIYSFGFEVLIITHFVNVFWSLIWPNLNSTQTTLHSNKFAGTKTEETTDFNYRLGQDLLQTNPINNLQSLCHTASKLGIRRSYNMFTHNSVNFSNFINNIIARYLSCKCTCFLPLIDRCKQGLNNKIRCWFGQDMHSGLDH